MTDKIETIAQCKPTKLQFMGVGNFAQSKVYVDVHPMEKMLDPGFWRAVVQGKASDRLYPGDTFTIRQVVWADASRDKIKEVLCRADCEVLATSKAGAKLAVLNRWDFKEETPSNGSKWNGAKAAYEIYRDGNMIGYAATEKEAEDIITGAAPLEYPVTRSVKWNAGKKVHEVLEDGIVIGASADKPTALGMAAGDLPLAA